MSRDTYKDYTFAKNWPSVTQVIRQKGIDFTFWYKKVGIWEAQRITEQSQILGHAMDEYREMYFKEISTEQDLRNMDKDTIKMYKQAKSNFIKFVHKFKPKRVMTQKVVYSPTKKYIGTFDDIYLIKGRYVLADGKATNSIGKDYKYQLEAYYRALMEMVDLKILDLEGYWSKECLWITQFPKKEVIDFDKHIVRFKPSLDRFHKGFLTLLTHYYYNKEETLYDKKI